MFITLQGAEWHDTKLDTGVICAGHNCFYSRCSPLCGSWRPHGVSHQTTSRQPSILRRWSCGVEQFAARHSYCINSFKNRLKTHSFFAFVFCSSIIILIWVAYVVRRPCSDFTDMLRRLTNCRIIIIIIIIIIVIKYHILSSRRKLCMLSL